MNTAWALLYALFLFLIPCVIPCLGRMVDRLRISFLAVGIYALAMGVTLLAIY